MDKKSSTRGERGKERMVQAENPDGQKVFYEGERGKERMVQAENPDGQKVFYEGGKRKGEDGTS